MDNIICCVYDNMKELLIFFNKLYLFVNNFFIFDDK